MRRHPLDPVSLVAGLLFAAVAVIALADGFDVVDDDGRWLWPALLIGMGLVGLAAALRSPTTGDGEPSVDEPTAVEPTAVDAAGGLDDQSAR